MFPKALPLFWKAKYNIAQTSWRLLSASVIDKKVVLIPNADQDSAPMKFPSVWLRDNCQCPECFHDSTKSRKTNWECINKNHKVAPSSVNLEKDALTIEWQDKHRSVFDLNWLKQRDFSAKNREKYLQEIYKPPVQLWGKKDFKNVWRTFEFTEVLNSDKALLAWLEALAAQGFAIVKNAPNDETVSKQLAERIGFVKRTSYGELFEVKSKENAHNYSYMMTPLPLHTDMPYYEYKAGIHILHSLVQSELPGGANLITDGFYIADKMRREHAAQYEVLLKTPVDWYDIGKDDGKEFHNIWRAPVICLDIDGNYHRINQSALQRDSHFSIPLEKVEPWYEAYDKFLELAYAESEQFKTKSGDVFVFNNLRMLHGRTAYEDTPGNKRHLIGAYVDWDIIYSKIRVLKAKN